MKKIKKSIFGRLKNGEQVFEYILKNKNNFTVKILNYGGIIREILAPDKDGNFENIVLGFDNIEDYEEKSPYFGCIVGRIAGRISNAKFKIDNQEYILSKNDGNNNIHGGYKSFSKVIWDTEEIITEDSIGVRMRYLSEDKEEGFPGNMKTQVVYMLNDNDELTIKYEAVSDKKTIINLTNHTYFNLSGDLKKNILNHNLTIDANKVIYVDEKIIPTGKIENVSNGVFDFTKSKKIGKDIKNLEKQLINCGGYDHPLIFNESNKFKIKLEDKKSGRCMYIDTDQPVVVVYTSNQMGKDLKLIGGKVSEKNLGVCLETQDYPDAINKKEFPTKIYNANEMYQTYTRYKFCVE